MNQCPVDYHQMAGKCRQAGLRRPVGAALRRLTLQLWILLLVTAVGSAALVSGRRPCERVQPYSSDPAWRFETVCDGRIYLSHQDRSGVTIWSHPAAGGSAKLVVRELHSSTEGSQLNNLRVGGGNLCYVLESSPTATSTQRQPSKRRARILRLNGGAPQTVAAVIEDASISFGDRSAYIIVPRGPIVRGVPTPIRDLWVQPLPRGSRRRLGVAPRGAEISATDDGLSYLVEDPPTRRLVRLSEESQEIRTHPDFEASTWMDTDIGLLWIRDHYVNGRRHRSLMQATDHAHTATMISVWPLAEEEGAALLVGQQGASIYFLTSTASRGPNFGSMPRLSLNRIRSDGHGGAERIATLPIGAVGPGVIDGDYCYFDCREPRENWMDWSPTGLSPRLDTSVQRVRLRNDAGLTELAEAACRQAWKAGSD